MKIYRVTSYDSFSDKYEYYRFLENGYIKYYDFQIIENNGNFIPQNINDDDNIVYFHHWVKVKAQYLTAKSFKLIEIEYNDLLCEKENFNFCTTRKEDSEEIITFYTQRNQKIEKDKIDVITAITNLDATFLDIAENLLNIAEEDIMLNCYIISRCHFFYSHVFKDEYFDEIYPFPLYISTSELKGKEKKETENLNLYLDSMFDEFTELIGNFVEIIMDEKDVNIYVARAIAWEALQRKAIEYYAKKWESEYDIYFEKHYNDVCKECQRQDMDFIAREYIKNIILYNEIDIDEIDGILKYFLLSKRKEKELIILDTFSSFYVLIEEVKKELESANIKQKLKTQKERKIIKYMIDDIDLMTGLEFEKFVDLLFKKMGYSTQLTKQSGDQGVDIIAAKNNTKIGIQAKCYSNNVGNSAIQEVVAGKAYYNCNKAIVITNNYFTSSAIDLAQSNNVVLWDRNMLKEKIAELF